jgi:TetR/AcrR family transcriptional regulator, transcriptional repressor for nem operon
MSSPAPTTADRVLDAAEALVQQRGYNGFSFDDIAQQVGIRKPSLYHHFASKGALGASVARRYTDRIGERLAAIEAKHADAPRRLAAYADVFAQAYAQDRRLCLCGMLGAEADALPDPVRDEVARFFAQQLEWLTRVIGEGQQSKTLRAGPRAAELALGLLAALEGAMVVGRGSGSDGEAAVRRVARTWLQLLPAPG